MRKIKSYFKNRAEELYKDDSGMEVIQLVLIILIGAIIAGLIFAFARRKTNDVIEFTDSQFDLNNITNNDSGIE